MASEPKLLGSILPGLVPPDVAAATSKARTGNLSSQSSGPSTQSGSEELPRCSRCGKPLTPVRLQDPRRPGVVRMIKRARCDCEDAEWEKEQLRLKSVKAVRPEESNGKSGDFELGKRFSGCSFENFSLRPETSKALDAARGFVDSFPDRLRDGRGLWFIGRCGTGKTRLAASILNEINARFGHPVAAVVAPHFLQRLRESYRSENTEDVEVRLMRRLQTVSCLLLDDLGAETSTPWGVDRIYLIIDHRNRHMLPTLVTSNFFPDELAERTDPRLVSRLTEMCEIHEMRGADYRLKKRTNGRSGAGTVLS